MKYSKRRYKITTLLYLISFILAGVVVCAFLDNLPSSSYKIALTVILSLPVISLAFLLYERHLAFKDSKDRYFSEVFQYSVMPGSNYTSFVQMFRMFTRSYAIQDPQLFVAKCIELGIDKYTTVANTDPDFPQSLKTFDPGYSCLDPSSDVMKYRGKKARLEYNAQRDIFLGSVLDNNLLHFSGSSVSELHQAFQKVVDNYNNYWAGIQDSLDSERNKD